MLKLMIVNSCNEIRIDQTPVGVNWTLVPLFKMTLTHGLISWQIGCNTNSAILNIVIEDEEGNITTELCPTIDGIPSIVVARRYYCQKYHEGYRPAGDITPSIVLGMKGYRYEDKRNVLWPAYVQPKLHGVRMLCQDDGRNINMSSYQNTSYTHLSHINIELKDFFAYLPRYAMLDGELYNHTMDFGTITSIVKTSKYVHPQLVQLQYYIFDINYKDHQGAPFEKRYELLVNAFRKYIQDRSEIYSETDTAAIPKTFTIVPCQIAHSELHMTTIHQSFINQGYEGSVIKKISNGSEPGTNNYKCSLYKPGKCTHILKYKDFYDDEATIIGIQDADNFIVQDHNNKFIVRSRIMINPDLIGKIVTYRYQNKDINGLPNSPIVIAIRDYE